MGTRKIKDAKDLDTGEKIYLKGHAQATYMSDGSTVEDTINLVVGGNTEKLVVTVSGISEGYTIYVMDENDNVIDSLTTSFKTYRIPAGTKYYVKGENVEGYTESKPTEIRTAYAYALNNVKMIYTRLYITTIRINQTISDPTVMITRIVDGGGIEKIRENSHRYTGIYSGTTMKLKQLDDNDGTKYLDGTAATLTTMGTDVWMKLPQFYYKCEEYATDIWDFSVTYGIKPDDSYKEWDGKDLIGVYETYNSSIKLYSVSGVGSSGNISQSVSKTYARNRGVGFTLVKWKHHCMMAMLFYAYYSNTNSQFFCGAGPKSPKNTGVTNALGMNDTFGYGVNGVFNSINFWGLENWWGNKYEWIDNVVIDARVWKVTEDDGTVRQAGTGVPSYGWTSKLLFGENLDLIPITVGGSETTGFCDYYTQSANNSCVVRRSELYESAEGGVASVDTIYDSSTIDSSTASRLAFRGDIVIES